MRPLIGVLLALVATSVSAATNTPFPAGTAVSITSPAGTVTGILQDIDVPQWISVLEAGQSSATMIGGTDVIIRRVSAEAASTDLGLAESRATMRGLDAGSATSGVRSLRPTSPRDELERDFRDRRTPTGHYIHGRPRVGAPERFRFTPEGTSQEVSGVTILVREAFTLGHYDKFHVPAWVAMRWTDDDYRRSEAVNLGRGDFVVDEDLPWYARGGTFLEYNRTGLQRGHMARDADLEAWGFDAVREGMRMSNIVPQQQHMNHAVWGKLEDEHRRIVAQQAGDIDTVWIISGPVFDPNEDPEWVGNDGEQIAVPEATYKVIAWLGEEDDIHVRAFIIGRYDTDVDLTNYLVPVQTVEDRTGLDFFHSLDDSVEEQLERALHTTVWSR